MAFEIIGKKIGMTQIFTDKGEVTAVTVVQAEPCVVLDLRTKDIHGYNAIRLGTGKKSEKSLNKPEAGLFKKINKEPCELIREFRIKDDDKEMLSIKPGDIIDISRFSVNDFVDVTGISKGKGFQGVVKRHGMSGGPGAHGTHFGREPGSTGNRELPGRVFKNKRMPGRMGREKVTVQNLKVLGVDTTNNILLLKGAVPGVNGSWIMISRTVKKKKKG